MANEPENNDDVLNTALKASYYQTCLLIEVINSENETIKNE